MSPVHALFGLHIVRRGLIFIDLAVAQVAALGVSVAIAYGHDANSPEAYKFAVASALTGALLISLSRFRLGRVPHEALIGVVYVLSTAASIIVLECAPSGHGLEELKDMLAGNIIFVGNAEVKSTAITYGVIMAVLLALWRPITQVTLTKDDPDRSKLKTLLLDFAFYGLLAIVVASSVKVAGVLVVFSWLVMPAIIAFFFIEKIGWAAAVAIPIGILGSIGGLLLSFYAPALHFGHETPTHDAIESAGAQGWPSGPAIVAVLGVAVILAYIVKLFFPDRNVVALTNGGVAQNES